MVSGHPQDGPLSGMKRFGLHLSGRLNQVLAITRATAGASPRRWLGWRFNHDPSTAEPNLPCHHCAARRIGRRRHWMIGRQLPPHPIARDIELVPHLQMLAQGFAVKSALEANDIVRLHRAADRDRGRRRCRGRGRLVLPKAAQRALHRRNQISELVGSDTVFGDITANDLGDQAWIDIRPVAKVGAYKFCAPTL